LFVNKLKFIFDELNTNTMKINLYSCLTEEAVLSNYELNSSNKLILVSNNESCFYEKIPVEKSNILKSHLYMVIKKDFICFADMIIKIIAQYNKNNVDKILAYPGHLSFQNIEKGCLRFHEKNLKEIIQLIDLFENSGIYFTENKKIENYTTKIEYKRFIEMEKIENSLFYDTNLENTYYIELEKMYEFDQYKKLISYLKNTYNIKSFDTQLVNSMTTNYDLKYYIMVKNNCFDKMEIQEFANLIKKDENLF
jgi:hypothetical protein